MTTVDDSPAADDSLADAIGAAAAPPPRSRLARYWDRFEVWLEWAGEHLNPILIKEGRQALKSRQFTVTFGLVLAAAWGWSFLGLAWMGPLGYTSANGPGLLFGYTVILLFALLIIVPYSAFRSLAAELEDRTYELLSITGLKARQIIGGKLASSFLQVLLFLSALAPCIAFTYLLRGVDILTIVVLLGHATLASIGLSLAGLLLATCSMERYRQVVASVVLVLALVGMFFGGCALAEDIVRGFNNVDLHMFWTATLAMLTAYGSYFLLLYLAAAAQLSFASSNRSTALRIVMVVQQALLCGWMAYFWLQLRRPADFVIALLMFSGAHWYAMGIFLNGEPDELSPRVRRDLPQSFLGRALFTWFNPGGGTGYMLAICSFLAVVVLAVIGVRFSGPDFATPGVSAHERVLNVGLLGFCYLTIYLGLGKLVLRAAQRASAEDVSILLRIMINLLLVACGSAIPTVIQMSSDTLRNAGYSLLQITNPLWTMVELAEPQKALPAQIGVLWIALPIAAAVVLLANLPAVAAEVRQVRIVKPARVAEEDAELAAKNRPAEALHTSPWD